MLEASSVLETVKLRLSLDSSTDSLVNSYISEIINRVKFYCNISEVPAELQYTIAAMVVDVLKMEATHIPAITATVVSEVRLGDATVKVAPPKKSFDDIVQNYANDLQSYRKLRW